MSPISSSSIARSHHHLVISPGRRSIAYASAGCARMWSVPRYSLIAALAAHRSSSHTAAAIAFHLLSSYFRTSLLLVSLQDAVAELQRTDVFHTTSPDAVTTMSLASPLGSWPRGHPLQLGQSGNNARVRSYTFPINAGRRGLLSFEQHTIFEGFGAYCVTWCSLYH